MATATGIPPNEPLPVVSGVLKSGCPVERFTLIEIKSSTGELVLHGWTDASYTPGEGITYDANQVVLRGQLRPSPIVICHVTLTPANGLEWERWFESSDRPDGHDISVLELDAQASTAYKIFVDGVEVLTLTTDQTGMAKVTFSSQPWVTCCHCPRRCPTSRR